MMEYIFYGTLTLLALGVAYCVVSTLVGMVVIAWHLSGPSTLLIVLSIIFPLLWFVTLPLWILMGAATAVAWHCTTAEERHREAVRQMRAQLDAM